jgi:predicted nucleotidyltransferase
MRLRKTEIENLKTSIYLQDKNALIYLFGSRTDKNLRGGDIDILIISKNILKKDRRKIKRNFFEEFGEQKLDLIIEKDLENLSPFSKEILEKAIEI